DRDVRARADRDADVGLRERRGVVDAVADHRDDAPAALELGHLRVLVLRAHAREDLVDAELARDRPGDGLGVARDHDDPDAAPVQRVHGLAGLRPDGVRERERAHDLTALTVVVRTAVARTPGGG